MWIFNINVWLRKGDLKKSVVKKKMDKAQVSLLLNGLSNQKGLTVYIAQVSQCPGWPMVNGRNITTGDQLQYWWKWALKEKRKGTALHTRSYTDWPEQVKIHDCGMAKLVATRQTTPNHLSTGNMSRLNQLATSISLSMVSIGQGYLCYFSIQSCLCHWKTKKKYVTVWSTVLKIFLSEAKW